MEAPPAARRPLELSTAGDRPETTGASPSPSPTGSSASSSSGKRRHPSSAAPPFRSPPPPSSKPWPMETLFRILCPEERTGFVIGKGGAVVRQLREETGARIRMEDPVQGCEDRVFVIVADAHPKKRTDVGGGDSAPEDLSSAQRALIKVFERILRVEEQGKGGGGDDGGGRGEEKEMLSSVVCRLLAPSSQVGCILGKGGKIIEKIRQETGAQVRILGRDYVPVCAAIGDEMIQISGSFSVVKKALFAVTSCLQDNPRTESASFAMSKAFGATSRGPGSLAQIDPYAQRGYLPSMHVPEYNTRGHSNPAVDVGMPIQRNIPEEEVVFRMLCSNDKVGSIIGKAGVVIRALQNETGSSIKILDSAIDSDERVILIASRETPEMRHSPAQDAVIRVHSRLSEVGVDKGSAASARLLVPAQQIGCLLGKGGTIIAEMRRATGASIRIFVKDQVPNCAQPNDEVVQVSGTLQSVHDALLHITGRLRETFFLLRGFPSPGMSHFNATPEMFRSGHELNHPGRFSTIGVPHGADHHIGLNDAPDRQPLSHTAEHLGIDQARFPYGNDAVGARPMHDVPSPRSWAPEVMKTGNIQSLPDRGNNMDCRSGMMESGNQIAVTSKSIEVMVPHQYLEFVYGDNGSNLADIKELSGASVAINNPKPGEAAGRVLISGALDQIRNAQSLLHAFILCGMDKQ